MTEAKRIKEADYKGEVYVEFYDQFFPDVGCLRDQMDYGEFWISELKIYGARRFVPDIDMKDVLDLLDYNHADEQGDGPCMDISKEAIQELQRFVTAWTQKHVHSVVEPDYSVIIEMEDKSK